MGCVERAAERAHLLGQRVNTRLKVADRSRYIAGNVRKLAGGLAGNGVDVNEEAAKPSRTTTWRTSSHFIRASERLLWFIFYSPEVAGSGWTHHC